MFIILSIKRSKLMLAAVLLLTAVLLTSCAQGQAHVTVHLDGTADLDLNASLSRNMLKLIGQTDLPSEIADNLRKNGMDATVDETESQSGIRVTKHMNLKDMPNEPLEMPEGVQITQTEDNNFFFTRHHIVVEVDPSRLLANSESGKNLQFSSMPSLAKKLVQSQLHFDLLLTTPIKLRDHNADETTDGGRTLIWHVKAFDNNRFELSFPEPHIRHIAYTAGPAILLLGAGVGYAIFRWRKRLKLRK